MTYGAWGVRWSRAVLLACVSAACGAAPQQAPGAEAATSQNVPQGPDGSRCDYRGRKDRAALVFKGAGSHQPNIRRVFAVSERQQDERVLRCREVDTNLDGKKDLFRTYDKKGEPLTEEADTNYDGRIDTWIKFAAGKIAEAEFDRNQDGKADEFRIYTGGKLARAQKDATLDGKLDTWEVFEDGRLTRVGVDTNGDGKVDEWHRDAEYEREKEAKAEAEEKKAKRTAAAKAGKGKSPAKPGGKTAK